MLPGVAMFKRRDFQNPVMTDGLHPMAAHAAKRSLTFPKSRSLDRVGSTK
jgi:hypothetical protein